jgi:hypothetical protein
VRGRAPRRCAFLPKLLSVQPLRVIQRFYEVRGGRILIDGQDIAGVAHESRPPLPSCLRILLCFIARPWKTSVTAGPTRPTRRSSKPRSPRSAATSSKPRRTDLQIKCSQQNQHRSRAAKYRGFLDISRSPGEISEFRNLEQSHATLADDEDWLARNVEKSSQSRNMTSQHQDTITMTLRPQRERRVCSPVPRSGCHGAVEYLA